MIDVVLLMASVVLWNHLELCDAVEKVLKYKFRIISCSKCGTFWLVLFYMLLTRHHIIVSVATSFFSAYTAIWFELLLGILATKYNELSQVYSPESDSEADASSEVSEV